MKSQEMTLNSSLSSAFKAIEEVERFAIYRGLTTRDANVLRLLTEEMISMATDVLERCEGKCWCEINGYDAELHLTAIAPVDEEAKKEFVSLSKEGVNAAEKGIKGKIATLFSDLMAGYDDAAMYAGAYQHEGFGSFAAGFISLPSDPEMTWSMHSYVQNLPVKERDAEKIDLEKSIIGGMSDDVVVSVRARKVEICVKKAF